MTAGTQTACDPANNTYTQQVTVTYENDPGAGTLDINGQSFAITSSPQTVTLVGLVADGAAVDATASFSADAGCSLTEVSLFTAPADCTPVGNTAPTALADEATTIQNTAVTIDVLANDTDSDGSLDAASVQTVELPQNGEVIINTDGTITYTPDTDFVGTDSFSYTVDDDEGATSNTATVDLTVEAVTSTDCMAPKNLTVNLLKTRCNIIMGSSSGSHLVYCPDTGR